MTNSATLNHAVGFLLVVLAFMSGTADARRIHHTNPLEELVQNYYSSTEKAPIDLLIGQDEDNWNAPRISKRQSKLMVNPDKPVVKKFMHNIYSEQFYS